jgi:hypothetical protein
MSRETFIGSDLNFVSGVRFQVSGVRFQVSGAKVQNN